MGARGRPPKPTNLRILHGDQKKRINFEEPPAPVGAPELPDSTVAEVRQVWHYTLKQLEAMDLVSTADRDALLAYCEAVVAHRMAAEAVHEHGALVVGASGSLIKNPALTAMHEAATQIARFAHHFGLTPSSRSEIRTGKARTSNGPSADRFLTG